MDNETLQLLYESGSLKPNPSENLTQTFWQAFHDALKGVNKGSNGQRRILSIIATQFTYRELQLKLGVSYKNSLSYQKNIELIKILKSYRLPQIQYRKPDNMHVSMDQAHHKYKNQLLL
jgi:hypothetical protein